MPESNLSASAQKIKVRLEKIAYSGWSELEVAIDCADTTAVYVTYPTIETILNYRADSVREKIASKSLKAFIGSSRTVGKKTATIVNKELIGATAKVTLLSLEDFQVVATWEACVNGNIDIAKLLAAGFVDSFRSIALQQLGIVLEVDARNEWIQTRLNGIEKRNAWTDGIKAWLDTHECSENMRRFMYSNVSDQLNRALTGYPAKYWCDLLNCNPNTLRNNWTYRHLCEIDYLEKAALGFLLKGNPPKEAMDLAIDLIQPKQNLAPRKE